MATTITAGSRAPSWAQAPGWVTEAGLARRVRGHFGHLDTDLLATADALLAEDEDAAVPTG